MKRLVLVAILFGFGAMLAAGRFYTAERTWIAGQRVGDPVRGHPLLETALRTCVAADDPVALPALRATGSYRTSGWFLPVARWSAVAGCMRLNGWLLVPVHNYGL